MSPEFDETDKPLVIRGHHLITLINFFNEFQDLSVDYRVYFEIESTVAAVKSREFEYQRDVLGPNSLSETIFRLKNRDLYERLLNLPDNYPVQIVAGKPDSICETCIYGKHCKKTGIDITAEELFHTSLFFGDEFVESYPDEMLTTLGELKRVIKSYGSSSEGKALVKLLRMSRKK